MKKLSVCVLFGGVSPEHDVSLRSAESVLNHLDTEKYSVFPVGIQKNGEWIHFSGTDYSMLPTGEWINHPMNRKVCFSPVRGQGLLSFEGDCVVRQNIDVVIPVLHGQNGEDGSVQGLLQLAGVPYVGANVAASAVAMDKTLTKLVIDHANIPQADWLLVTEEEFRSRPEAVVERLQERFVYPMFVKPAGTGSSVGVSKVFDRETLMDALAHAAEYDKKILVEEFIHGREVEVAVMGNNRPFASVCGEIDSGVEFYDYDAKYVTDTSIAYIPARIPEDVAEQVRDYAIRVYQSIGCTGLSRVDFFVTFDENRIVFNEINTLPGFTSISMFPKLFEASGIAYEKQMDELIRLALEVSQ